MSTAVAGARVKGGIKSGIPQRVTAPVAKGQAAVAAAVNAGAVDARPLGSTKEERAEMWDRFLRMKKDSECHPSIVGFTEDTFMEFINDEIREYWEEKSAR